MHTRNLKSKTTQNIDFTINIGGFKLKFSLPKHTTVHGLISIIRGYEELHQEYGPLGQHFIGLGAQEVDPLLDYWLTQSQLDFTQFGKKLQLKALYGGQRNSDKLSANEWQFLTCLGKGACGEVYLVRSRYTGAVFALKRVTKDSILNYEGLMTQFRQRKIMMSMGINSHTVVLHASFQSKNHFNFLMQYYPGGELFIHLSDTSLSTQYIRIYFCEILLAMQFLHKRKILYRDLKPQNIMVDAKGHLRIGDFGMSKCDFEEDAFALSSCGSAQYMAPEVLAHKQYNFSADFYSLGALLYELLTGQPPYYRAEQQKLQLMNNMDLQLNSVTSDIQLQQLLLKLLHPDPSKRLSNFKQIKTAPWLAGVDWKEIEDKNKIMPFAPNPSKLYIPEEFIQLQEEVEEMNYHFQDDDFINQISYAFQFVRPESKKILGIIDEAHHGKVLKPKQIKPDKKLKKVNFSMALYERQDSTHESSCSEGRSVNDGKQNRKMQNTNRTKTMQRGIVKQSSVVFLKKAPAHTINLTKPQQQQKSQRNLLIDYSHQESRTGSRMKETVAMSKAKSKDRKEVGRSKEKVGQSKERTGQERRGQSKERTGESRQKKELSRWKESRQLCGRVRRQEKKTVLPTCSYRIKLN